MLLQARVAGDPAIEEEHELFARYSGLPMSAIQCHDLLDGPPEKREWSQMHGFFVGGSGDFYIALGNLPHQSQFLEFLRVVVFSGKPMFASCFGFQALVEALGGRIIHDPDSREVGTFPIRLSADGRKDPLLGVMPTEFAGQLGRKDRAMVLPQGIPSLAGSERCPFQAIRVPGRVVWATQFHPELSCTAIRKRVMRYLDSYVGADEGAHQRVLDSYKESPDSQRLLKEFMALAFSPK